MSELRSRTLPTRAEPPDSIFFNQPSVERTGHGEQLILDEWGGRWFRASESWVRNGCENIMVRYENGEYLNYNDLYAKWNIEPSDFGAARGWAASPDWKVDLSFVFTWHGPGTSLYDKFGEKVLLVELAWDAFPFESYMEV